MDFISQDHELSSFALNLFVLLGEYMQSLQLIKVHQSGKEAGGGTIDHSSCFSSSIEVLELMIALVKENNEILTAWMKNEEYPFAHFHFIRLPLPPYHMTALQLSLTYFHLSIPN